MGLYKRQMTNYIQTNIIDLLDYAGKDICQDILSTFICPLNPDVESFLRTKATPFARQRIAISYLVFRQQDNQQYLIGYYTLANKFICVSSNSLSNTLKKKISKFSQYDPDTEQFMMPIPLIAQLGKNFNPALPFHMTGSDLLHLALKRVFEIERLIGGKTVYVECNNQPRLFEFYSSAGFFQFNTRIRTTAVPNETNPVLIQMLKYDPR